MGQLIEMSGDKESIIENINLTLQKSRIDFAYLFGSFAGSTQYRDIDLGVYAEPPLQLMELGGLQTQLTNAVSAIVNCTIDLIQLNGIPDKNPEFAYRVVTQGKLIINRRPDLHTRYKRTAFLYYFDTEYLRTRMNRSFEHRLKSGRFGARDYA